MSLKRLFTLSAMIVFVLAAALPALAEHGYSLVAVTCDANTNTVRVYYRVEEESSASDTYVYADGALIAVVDPYDDSPDGVFSFSVTDPAFDGGTKVLVTESGEDRFQLAAGPSGSTSVSTTCGGPGAIPVHLLDGRINNDFAQDIGAPVAIYDGSVDVFAVNLNGGEGDLVLSVSDDEIEAAGVPEDGSIVLGEAVNTYSGQAVTLYRLATGEYQLNTFYADGKPYIVVWSGNGEDLYHLAA